VFLCFCVLSSYCVLCSQCCQFLWNVHFRLPFWFSPKFVLHHNTELKTYILTQVLWKGKTLIVLTDFTSLFFPHSWIITGFVTRLTRREPLVKQELPTLPEHLAPEFTPVFHGVHVKPIFSFICMFCRLLCVLLPFFFCPLCRLSFSDLRILITPLVSSNSFSCLITNVRLFL
jgi:hypothetical protein